MSVILKRSEGRIPRECAYGCCTTVYGKHVQFVRRAIKRSERGRVKREISRDIFENKN